MDGEIRPEQLEDALEDGDEPLVVDIRNPGHYQRGHIPESVNVPLPELTREVERFADADHVVTVCPHGKASVKAARLISASGAFDGRVESLAGGLSEWDGPLEHEGGAVEAGAETEDGQDIPF